MFNYNRLGCTYAPRLSRCLRAGREAVSLSGESEGLGAEWTMRSPEALLAKAKMSLNIYSQIHVISWYISTSNDVG